MENWHFLLQGGPLFNSGSFLRFCFLLTIVKLLYRRLLGPRKLLLLHAAFPSIHTKLTSALYQSHTGLAWAALNITCYTLNHHAPPVGTFSFFLPYCASLNFYTPDQYPAVHISKNFTGSLPARLPTPGMGIILLLSSTGYMVLAFVAFDLSCLNSWDIAF